MLRRLSTKNPFYALSALLVLVGLRNLFPAEESTSYAWALMTFLGAYTSLLAFASWAIVRFGNVWDDARSVLLVIAILLLALSTSFDEKVIQDQNLGAWLIGAELVFAIVLAETLLRALRIRLPSLFRLPVHFFLVLFSTAPLVLSSLLHSGDPDALRWGACGFPVLFGGGLLALLPAVRRGRDYVRDNGTPWAWPWFPWTLVAIFVLGACVRTYLLCVSFGISPPGRPVLSPWLIVPILLAVAILVLEGAIVARSRRMQTAAVVALLGVPLAAFAFASELPLPAPFLDMFIDRGASPAFVAFAAAAIPLVFAAVRGVRAAEVGLAGTILLFGFLRRDTVELLDLPIVPHAAPLFFLSLLALISGFRHRTSASFFVALAALVSGLTLALRDTPFVAIHGALPIHVLLLGSLAIGLVCRDRFAHWLRDSASVAGVVLAATALVAWKAGALDLTAWVMVPWVAALVAGQFACAYFARLRFFVFNGFVTFALAAVALGHSAWLEARSFAGIEHIATVLAGVALLVVAVTISLAKGGLLGPLKSRMVGALGRLSRRPSNGSANGPAS